MEAVPAAAVALLPAVHVAWSNGILEPHEMAAARDAIRAGEWADPPCREWVARWLDPGAPPPPRDLLALRDEIRARARRLGDGSGEAAAPSLRSLSGLGLALARGESASAAAAWGQPAAGAALEAFEAALGVAPAEAVAVLLGRPSRAPRGRAESGVDADTLNLLLDGSYRDTREDLLALLSDPRFQIPSGTPMSLYRERVLDICRALADRGYGALSFPPEFGGESDTGRFVAVFETLAYGDLSVTVKFGVQFGLFGGSVLQLGTRRHHERYLSDIGSLRLPGCFAMTETGHGSNVRDVETIARYDAAAGVFVLHSPSAASGKDWIGGAARDARMATVFAQLETGGERHGVHALLVPIRGENGAPLPGIRIEDRGLKQGLNGVDNGQIWFDGVRVPRENLLDRFASVSEDGTYSSPIPGADRRFFTMLGTLVAGRVSIAAAAVSAAKTALTIAIRHTDLRTQFGREGEREEPLLEYRAMQRSLLPRLADTYALHFAVRALIDDYAALESGADTREIEARAAGLKAAATWHAMDTLRACREACGGAGYAADSRFGQLAADADAFTTFEGANFVLLQLLAKGLLTEYREEFGDMKMWTVVRFLTARAGERLAELDPIGPRKSDPEHLRDPAFHEEALEHRARRLTVTAAARVKARLDDGMDSFTAVNETQDHLIALALAHVDRLVLGDFARAVTAAGGFGGPEVDGSGGSAEAGALRLLYDLHALRAIERRRAWYLESGLMEPSKTRAVRREINTLCAALRPHAPALVSAFGIPDAVLGAPIGLRDAASTELAPE